MNICNQISYSLNFIRNDRNNHTPFFDFKSDEGRQLAEEHGMKFLEGSAKDGTGIAEAFQELAQLIWHAQQVRRASGHDHSGDDIIHLQEIPVYDKRKRKCCGGVEGIFS